MITLDDEVLGELDLRADPFVVTSFQIGSRTVRSVMRNRALANGSFDDTKYTGGRAVTIGLTLNEKLCGAGAVDANMQALFDRLLPYMEPRRRYQMRWSLPGSGAAREMTVRGDLAPVVIARAKHPTVSCSFVCPDGEITDAGDPTCVTISSSGTVELGRVYNLVFNRTYPPSTPVGGVIVNQPGNTDAHWTAAIFALVTNPTLSINGVVMNFNNGGGLNLTAGQSVVIDTRERTIYLNGDPAFSRYDRTNFTAWQWDDLLLKPGDNQVVFGGSAVAGGTVNLCYRPTWAG